MGEEEHMNKLFNFVTISLLLAGVSFAEPSARQNVGSDPQNTAIRFAPGTTIRVELEKSVDAKKAKVGDEVVAKTTDDLLSDKNEVLAPRGSRVLAHVAEVSQHQGDAASTLGIAFDKIVLKSGAELPLKAFVQAIGRPEPTPTAVSDASNPPGNSNGMSPMSSPRGGYNTPNQGVGAPGAPNPGSSIPDATSSSAGTGQLALNAQGVVGMSGVSLSTGATQDSVLTSQKHNVKLDSGTQMILRVIP
jgi:hypothetical protein